MNRYEVMQPEEIIKPKIGDRVKPHFRKISWESKKRGEVIEFGTYTPEGMSWVRWDPPRSVIVCWDNALLMYE